VRALSIRSADEAAIAASEARYRELVEQQRELISLARPDGELIYVNPAYARQFGLRPEDLIGRNLFDFVDAVDRPAVRERFARVLSGQTGQTGENRNVDADGRARWIAWTNTLQRDAEGRPILHSVGRDITEQRQAEAALQASQAFLARTGRVAGIGGWQLDLASGHLEWSAQTRAIHEVGADFVPTLDAAIGFYAPQARQQIEHAVQAALAGGDNWDLELPLVTATGRPIWVRAVGEVEFEGGRATRMVGAFQDITERRQMEARLAEAAERLHDLYDNAPCGYHSLDAEGRFVQINELALSWLGCRREEVLHRLGPQDFFSEAGRSLFRLMYPVFKDEGSLGPIEFELRSRDGTVRWVSIVATAIRDAAGAFVQSRSVMYDVTEVHAARAALRRLTIEQRAMLDNDVVGIVKLRDRVAVWKNRALERMFGYEPDELLNQPSRLLYEDDRAYEDMGRLSAAALAASGRFRTQLQMRRKSGRLLWIDTSGVLLSPETGESMWVLVDITQMKQYQLQVEHIAFHDALTRLPNRLLLADRMQQAIALDERLHRTMAVCYLDLDGFKAVNDQYGHEAGDRLLVEVARRLLRCVRQSDTVARLGGDEFVVLLTPVDGAEECRVVLDRIIEAVRQPVELPGQATAQVSASIGVALYPANGHQATALLAQADDALYEAKRAGKNRVYFAPAGAAPA